jgi:ornithine cyclodeaminase/alanine dehydrogenase-like protein (mu-crystallin family)
MILLSDKDIERIAPVSNWIEAMELAIKSSENSEYYTPNRIHVDIKKNTLLIMPSVGPQYFITKLITVFPENHRSKVPVINGNVVVNDSKTGETLALLNGAKLTAMRTAAIANTGIKYLSKTSDQTIGIIGAGEQGKHIAWFATELLKLKKIHVYDNSDEMMDDFEEFILKRNPDTKVIRNETSESLVADSDIVITATTSMKPVFPNDINLVVGKAFIGVGSYKPDMREFPEAVFKSINKAWVDADHGKVESGDLIYPVQNNLLDKNEIRNISELITGSAPKENNNTRMYKTVGLATFDLFAASMVYEIAISNNNYCKIQL